MNSLSQGLEHPLEGVLPSIHLDDPDASNDLIHNAHTLVSLLSRLESKRKRVHILSLLPSMF